MKNFEKNVELKPGDTVICLYMEDITPIPGGTPGVVRRVSEVYGQKQYYVDWKNGSRFALIEGEWVKCSPEEAKKQKGKQREVRQDEDGNWEYKNGDAWIKTGSSEENVNENFMFFTTKRSLINEVKKNKK